MRSPLDKEELSKKCLNCAENMVNWYAICSDCIHTREETTTQEGLWLLSVFGRLTLAELKTLETSAESRKIITIGSHKPLFDRPSGGRFSPQTRMNPEFLALSLGSLRSQRAVLVSAEWLYEGIRDVMGTHLPGVTYQNTDIYLNTVALFVNIAGRYALSLGGDAFQGWLLDRVVQLWIREAVTALHPRSVDYRMSTIIGDDSAFSTKFAGFIQQSEEKYGGCEFVTGSLLEDMLDEHTVIGIFHKVVASCINFSVIEDVAAIRFIVRHIVMEILEQPWLRQSVADAVIES